MGTALAGSGLSSQLRRDRKITLYSEPNGHAIDLDSSAKNWSLSSAPYGDFSVEHYRVGAGSPAQLSEVDKSAGFDTCVGDTGYRQFVELRNRGLRDGDQLTFCVHTDLGRYAVLLVTVHGDGTSFSSLEVDIRVW